MKKSRIDRFALIMIGSLLTACTSAADSLPNQKESVIAPMSNPTKLDNVFFVSTGSPVFSVGFLIDSEGVNYPAVHVDEPVPRTWRFPDGLRGTFIYSDQLLINDLTGRVYKFENPNWRLTEIKLKPRSKVVWSTDDIIACTTPLGAKAGDKGIGECYAVGAGWSANFNVHAQPLMPAVCEGNLRLIDFADGDLAVKEIELREGRVLSSKHYKYVPQDQTSTQSICEILQ